MFNLKAHKEEFNDLDLLRIELRACGIVRNKNGFSLEVGDDIVQLKNLSSCLKTITQAIEELKQHILNEWQELASISNKISSVSGHNVGGLDNLIFLNSVKQSFNLSKKFPDLFDINNSILAVMESDILSVDNYIIKQFNLQYLKIKCLHKLIMYDLYRTQLIQRYTQITKMAQISGPWSNLDLPKEERVWLWDSQEDQYFMEREKDIKSQTRYNPEDASSTGFYFVWNEPTRSPYPFGSKDSPYKTRDLLTIASKISRKK